jgi:tRNA G18 (ribose-2'-O)-methylase SpoU
MQVIIEQIEDVDDSRIDIFRSLKTSNLSRDSGLFVAEGTTVVERVLLSRFQVSALLVSNRKWSWFQEFCNDHEGRFCTSGSQLNVYRMSHSLAEQLAGFAFHSGVMVAAYRRPEISMNDLVAGGLPSAESVLLLAGERIVDPENVGSMIRIASAFGAAAVILGPGSADPFSRRVLRVSMGNVLQQPVIAARDLAATLKDLKTSFGFQVCATLLSPSAVELAGHQFHSKTVLVFGNEYDGVSPVIQEVSDVHLTIPMLNQTDSLNLAVAAGICAYQFRTQYRR